LVEGDPTQAPNARLVAALRRIADPEYAHIYAAAQKRYRAAWPAANGSP
jgi:hypothetical protein